MSAVAFSGRSVAATPAAAWLLSAAAIAAILSFPFWINSDFLLYLAVQGGIYLIVAIGLNLLMGFTGQVSLGHGALVGIGAYGAAILMTRFGLSFWAAAPLAVVVTCAVGALMALPALRLSAWYFALVTLIFAQALGEVLVEWRGLTGGFRGIIDIPPPSLWGEKFNLGWIYILVSLIAMGLFALVRNVVKSRVGIAMVAARDNPLAATASGISLVRLKMLVFTASAAMAGLGGALFAVQKTLITPEDFTADFSIFFLLIVVVGGLGKLWGPVVGTLIFFLVPELLGALQEWRVLVYGVLLLLLMIFAPKGVAGFLELAWQNRGVKRRRQEQLKFAGQHEEPAFQHASIRGAGLAILGVEKRFGGLAALSGVDLIVERGKTHAIVGPNGSGKTTLLNVVSGYFAVDAGVIRLDDGELTGEEPHRIARQGVARTFQTPKLLGGETLLDNVLLGSVTQERSWILEIASRLPRARKEASRRRDEAMGMLDFVGLRDRAFDLAGDLPHGQQRLLEIARALAGCPRIILLDEPAAGLSMSELDRLSDLIRMLSKSGMTVVIVEHHLDLVVQICDAVTVLDRGRVLARGTPEEVFSHPEVVAAYIGKSAREQAA